MTVPSPRKKTAKKPVAIPEIAETARDAKQKAMTLADATEKLSSRVSILADAVQITNQKIDDLQREVNCKPDDAEIQFISGLAKAERKALFTRITSGAVAAAVVAAFISYGVASYEGKQRCQINSQNIDTLVSILESTPSLQERYATQIADLKSNRNDC